MPDTSILFFGAVIVIANLLIMYLIIQSATRSINMEKHALAQGKLLKLIAEKHGATKEEISNALKGIY